MGGWYRFGYILSQVIAKTLFSFKVMHRERIIEEGGVILAMNHESYLDPPLAGIACRRELHYLARKTLQKWPILGPILPDLNVVPVDQDRADMSALKTIIRIIRAGGATVIFPEGSRTLDGALQPAQPGLGLVIAKTLAPVVPMRIFGAHRAFPRGGKPRPFTPITLVVGEPIFFTKDDLVG
jgi:1-acyl-sn-glycerol-3-phosphate acyltransferase